jgi:AcrR family transcriptional regulator
MVRRTSEDTRRLILEAGVQMLLERGATAGVQHIRLQEVLRSVDLTTGAAYRIWADQTEFHRDLAVEMLGSRFAPPVHSAASGIRDVLELDASLDEVVRTAAADYVEYVTRMTREPDSQDAHAFVTALALRAAAGSWPELQQATAERHRESVVAFAEFYAALLARFGRRLRSPLTIVDFTEAMAALGEGFAVRAAEGLGHPVFDIPEGAEVPAGRWTLFGIGIQGLLASFTVPVDAGTAKAAPARGE